jgi:hypothetical protein
LFKNKTKFKGSLKLGGGVAMIEKGVERQEQINATMV